MEIDAVSIFLALLHNLTGSFFFFDDNRCPTSAINRVLAALFQLPQIANLKHMPEEDLYRDDIYNSMVSNLFTKTNFLY